MAHFCLSLTVRGSRFAQPTRGMDVPRSVSGVFSVTTSLMSEARPAPFGGAILLGPDWEERREGQWEWHDSFSYFVVAGV